MIKRNLTLILMAAVAIIAIVAGILVNVNRPPTPQERLESSKTWEYLTSVTTVNGIEPASVIVAPSNQDWWNKLAMFSTDPQIESVDYESLSEGSTYLAYTNSPGNDYESYGSIGLSTTFIIYEEPEQAEEAAESVEDGTSYFVRGNMLFFVPAGAFTDVDYAVDQFIQSEELIDESDLELNGEAIWQFNFSSFSTIYTQNREGVDIQTYNDFLSLMGVTPETGWVGFSEDGLSWDGDFYGLAYESIASPATIQSFLADQVAYLKDDGTIAYSLEELTGFTEEELEEIVSNEGPLGLDFGNGVIYPRQSYLLEYMTYATQEEVMGGIYNFQTLNVDAGETIDEGIAEIVIVPNSWLAFMMDEGQAYPLTPFGKATITILNTDGESRIVLELEDLSKIPESVPGEEVEVPEEFTTEEPPVEEEPAEENTEEAPVEEETTDEE